MRYMLKLKFGQVFLRGIFAIFILPEEQRRLFKLFFDFSNCFFLLDVDLTLELAIRVDRLFSCVTGLNVFRLIPVNVLFYARCIDAIR